MNITWTISTCQHDVATGFITVGHWQATATDGDFSASVYSTCGWQAGTPIIPYANVTQANVLDWCWTSGVDKDAVEASLAQQIEAKRNPVTATGTPWTTA